MEKLLHVSPSPHIRSSLNTKKIMGCVLLALSPSAIFGIYYFGIQAFILLSISMSSAVLFEYLYERYLHLPITIMDGSALVTGLFIGLNIPASAPWWLAIFGSFFGIIVVKQLFGGIGQNILNPALAARCFLTISFAGYMSTYFVDGVSCATPLVSLNEGTLIGYELLDLIIGTTPGTIGETSAIALLIGGLFLLHKKIISYVIPVYYLLSFSIFIFIFSNGSFSYVLAQVCSGGIMLGAWFMASDYTTSPTYFKGKLYYGIFLGVLTGIFRLYGASSEGVTYAILFGNLLVPLIDRYTIPKPFGKGGEKK